MERSYLADLTDSIHHWIWMNSAEAKNKTKRPKSVVPAYILKAIRRKQNAENLAATGQATMNIDDLKSLLARERK